MNKKLLAVVIGSLIAANAFGQTTPLNTNTNDPTAPSQNNQCNVQATSCTGSNQNSGDVTTTTNSGTTHSNSAQQGNSSAANPSNTSINPTIDTRPQVTQNATNTTTGTISGGNTTSSANGGSSRADGNTMGNMTTGASTSSVGPTSNENARLVDCINTQPPTRRNLIDRAERVEAELAAPYIESVNSFENTRSKL